jgi:hypothetical protein
MSILLKLGTKGIKPIDTTKKIKKYLLIFFIKKSPSKMRGI